MEQFEEKINATILGIVYHPELRDISVEAKGNISEMVRTLAESLILEATKQAHALHKLIDQHTIETHVEGAITDERKRTDEAFKILMKYNRIGNDLDAYLFDVAEWGMGEREKEPNPQHFGI